MSEDEEEEGLGGEVCGRLGLEVGADHMRTGDGLYNELIPFVRPI